MNRLRILLAFAFAATLNPCHAQTTVSVPGQAVQVAPSSVTVPQDPAIPALAARVTAAEAAIKALQAAPVPDPCPAQPAPNTRTQACPAGQTGSWQQTSTFVAVPAPTCWSAGAWAPATAPAGACTDSPTPPTSSIAETDIFAGLDGNLAFVRAKGGNVGLECAGQTGMSVNSTSDTAGFVSGVAPVGMRFGKVADPFDASKKVLQFAPTRNDPLTGAGSKRCEASWWITQPGAIKPYIDIWHAFGLLMPDGGFPAQAVISQYHQTTKNTENPWSAIQAEADRLMLFVRYNTTVPPTRATNQTRTFASPGIPTKAWTVIVIKMRIDPRAGGQGYFQAWRDGVKFADYTGPTAYATIDQNPTWQKFGFYPWNYSAWSSPTTVRVLFKAPVFVRDPTGSRYTEAALRAYVLAR